MDLKRLYQISDYEWMLNRENGMKADAFIIANETLIREMDESVAKDLSRLAAIPGIVGKVVALPNAGGGIASPVGSVMAFEPNEAVLLPELVGYDVHCGLRFMTTNLISQDIEKKGPALIREFSKLIPSGLAEKSKFSLVKRDLSNALRYGAKWAVEERGIGREEDLDYIENGGYLEGANPSFISEEVLKREKNRLGTLGGGSHYLELQIVDEIYDIERARVFGLFKNQVVVTVHTGSRTLGAEVVKACQERFRKSSARISVSGLFGVPLVSQEGQECMAALKAAANYAYLNRQVIASQVDKVLNEVIKDVETNTMYDLAHHSIMEEKHRVGATSRNVLVYRHGASRAFPGSMAQVPRPYRVSGHPVILSGTYNSPSYVLSGTQDTMMKSFGSVPHCAGRKLSAFDSASRFDEKEVVSKAKERGVFMKIRGGINPSEYAPEAFNNVEDVLQSINKLNMGIRVARLRAIGVLKG